VHSAKCIYAIWENVRRSKAAPLLNLLTSFLQDRSFMVAHGSTRSRWILAPWLRSRSPPLHHFHCRPGTHACGWGCPQSNADDLQAYVHCSAGRAISEVETIGQAMETLQAWMSSNRLRLTRPRRSSSGSVPVSSWLRLTLGSLPLNTRTSPSRPLSVTWEWP